MATWNNGFTSYKYKGQTFAQWCRDNGYTYMLQELDFPWLNVTYGFQTIEALNRGFDKKIRWVCAKGHAFMAKPVHRTNGQMLVCPYCKGSRLSTLDHSIRHDMPAIVSEWDTAKNGVTADEVVSGSGKKYWWICPNGHSYQSSPSHRRDGRGCPYCANLKIMVGYNDLATTHPELAKEWDYQNNTILPTQITYGNDKKVWWVCSKGHHYQCAPIYRTYNKNGCPYCSQFLKTSFAEQAIYYYLSHIFYNVKSRIKIDDFEFDVALLDEKILIEYNGEYWHEDKESKDKFKQIVARRNGYRLITVKSARLSSLRSVNRQGSYTEIVCRAEKSIKGSIDYMVCEVINQVFGYLNMPCPDLSFVDVAKDEATIMKLYNGDIFLDTSAPGDAT